MEGKEAIIKRIISDAEDSAKVITDNAKQEASKRISSAKEWAKDYTTAQEKLLKKDAEDIVTRRLTVADLDCRKIVLSEKQGVISEVLQTAYKKLCSLNKDKYLKLITSLINQSADEGDVVILSSDKVLSKDDILSLPIAQSKKLTVAKASGEFVGGVILEGKICDKDLSFKTLIENGKDCFIAEIAEDLF